LTADAAPTASYCRAMPELYLEDLVVGTSGECPPLLITREEIIAFAREFDPQPFHLSEEAAKGTFVGELIASGWHTCSLTMRIMHDDLIHKSASMGAPGVEEVKWLKPVRPDDTLRARWNVLETRLSRSRPGMGLARMRVVLFNQRDEMVYDMSYWQMAGRRGASPHQVPGGPTRANASNGEPAATPEVLRSPSAADRPAVDGAGFFEDFVVGETSPVGEYHFTAENIIRFAEAFDPQPFHVDPQAAAKSHFGALCASGWHTGCACMRKLIDRRTAIRERIEAEGKSPPAMGSSPGFRNLVWHKPVYAGDTISFATTLVSKRASASRPRWGLIFSRNTGTNQKGELVYEFTGSVFIERRP
jgi:acyl dehydratase